MDAPVVSPGGERGGHQSMLALDRADAVGVIMSIISIRMHSITDIQCRLPNESLPSCVVVFETSLNSLLSCHHNAELLAAHSNPIHLQYSSLPYRYEQLLATAFLLYLHIYSTSRPRNRSPWLSCRRPHFQISTLSQTAPEIEDHHLEVRCSRASHH